ncbi:hypothetical protein [Synechocystis sp. LKSZ1]|uniref:hypothetical protein n=1 Tax=Synechocystis sp. LKSZ1 TaxID=3144951 RepID=UPI00336C2CD7
MTTVPSSPSTEASSLPKEIQEITLTLAVKELDPALLSEQFLKFSGIIPNEWELARPAVVGPNGSQLMFKNGLGIVAQPRVINFMETMTNKAVDDLAVAATTRQFVQKLPNAEYLGLTISPKCLIPFPDQADGARKYITQTLLNPGPWQDFGKAPVQAGVNFLYQFEGCQLTLNINQALLQIPDQPTLQALLFSGNFTYRLEAQTPADRIPVLEQYLGAWQSDLQTFRSMIYDRFLAQQQPMTVFG